MSELHEQRGLVHQYKAELQQLHRDSMEAALSGNTNLYQSIMMNAVEVGIQLCKAVGAVSALTTIEHEREAARVEALNQKLLQKKARQKAERERSAHQPVREKPPMLVRIVKE